MKRIIAFLLILSTLLTSALMTSCGSESMGEETTDQTTQEVQEESINNISLLQDGKSVYRVIRSDKITSSSPETEAMIKVRRAIEAVGNTSVELSTDWVGRNVDPDTQKDVKEILIGHTNRSETAAAISDLKVNEFIIKVSGTKIIICGYDETTTQRAAYYFIDNYLNESNPNLELPADLSITLEADLNSSIIHDMTYTAMADTAMNAYIRDYYHGGALPRADFWDTAEILEAFIDAYEQTGNEEYLTCIKGITKHEGNKARVSWLGNEYNDDLAWMCIAYTRIYLLTDEKVYLTIAKNNFDGMYERAISDDLGGGLFWRTDNQTKNSCVNCPSSIAACLLAKATGDDSYYEIAKELMNWEFTNMFGTNGAVYDSYKLSGEINQWASSYNQGTFIGACTLLHEKYGDEIYLTNAALAAEYAMNNLDNAGGVLNGEASGGDLIGFKGILVRWLYRYAKYTDNRDILTWLQLNADSAFENRNSQDLIWTTWASKTPENVTDLDIFGFSTAISLLFNCQPWW